MRVTCEYCDSYVAVENETNCPFCGAPLGDAIRAEERRKREEADRLAKAEAERAAAQVEQQRKQQIMQTVANVAGVAAGTFFGLVLRSPRGPRGLLGRGLLSGKGPRGKFGR